MRLGDLDALARRIRIECNPYGKPTIDFESGKKVLKIIDNAPTIEERPKGKWIVTNQDSDGIHEIKCPFCKFLKGGDFWPHITITFDYFPPFCESCGADMRGE